MTLQCVAFLTDKECTHRKRANAYKRTRNIGIERMKKEKSKLQQSNHSIPVLVRFILGNEKCKQNEASM